MQPLIIDNVSDVVEVPRAMKRIRIDQTNEKDNQKIGDCTVESLIQARAMIREVFGGMLHTSRSGDSTHRARPSTKPQITPKKNELAYVRPVHFSQ